MLLERLIADDPLVMQPRLESFRSAEALTGAETTSICDIGHQGLMHDKEFGLIYNRARYLHPVLGRFLQRDPLGYVDGMSMYEYVRSGPVGRLDPTGRRFTNEIPNPPRGTRTPLGTNKYGDLEIYQDNRHARAKGPKPNRTRTASWGAGPGSENQSAGLHVFHGALLR